MDTVFRNVGRNDLCPCGSGKKYKKCCVNKVIPLKPNKNEWEKILDIDDDKLFDVQNLIREAYKANKKNNQFFNNIAVMLGSSGYNNEAIYFHEKAIELKPTEEVNSLNYAVTLDLLNKSEKAIEIVESLSDDTERKLVIEANIKMNLLPFEDIAKIYEKAIALDPKDYLPYLTLIENSNDNDIKIYWIEKAYSEIKNDADITFLWVIHNFQKCNFEILNDDKWIESIENLSGDYSIIGQRDYVPEKIELLKEIKKLSGYLFDLHYRSNYNNDKYEIEIKKSINYFIKNEQAPCLIFTRLLDIINNYGWLDDLKNVFECYCDDCKNSINYDGLLFQTLKNIPGKENERLELGKKLITSKNAKNDFQFVSEFISFVDDELGSHEAIKLSREILKSKLKEKTNPFLIRILWDLAIIACKSGNWLLGRECFEDFKKVDFKKFLELQNEPIKNFYIKHVGISFFWVDYNIYICSLALKSFKNPEKIDFLEWLKRSLDFYNKDIHLDNQNKYIRNLYDWCRNNSNNKFYLNNFSQNLKKSNFFTELSGKIKSDQEIISINNLMLNRVETNLSSKISKNLSIMQHIIKDEGDFSGIFNILENDIPQLRLLPEEALSSLIEAENRRQNEKNVFDYAPSIVSYCKCLEIFIRENIFKKYLEKVSNSNLLEKLVLDAAKDKNYNQFFGLVKFFKTGFLELGTISQILKLLDGKTVMRVELLSGLKLFLETNYPNIIKQSFRLDLYELSKDYRNPATHVKPANKEENEEVRKNIFKLINDLFILQIH